LENLWDRLQDKMINGQFQITASGWEADYPDPENFFFLFYSKNVPPQGSNHSRYSNPEFDRIYEKMCSMDNTPERLELVHKLTAILNEDCPVVLLLHQVLFSLYQPWAEHIPSNPLAAYGAIKYETVDTALRNEQLRELNHPVPWPLYAGAFFIAVGVAYGIIWSLRRNV